MGWLRNLISGRRDSKAVKPGRLLSLRQAAEENVDVIAGWTFCATLSTKTPLEWLRRHGETRATAPNEEVPPAYGIWVIVTKSWAELGIDLPEMPPGTMASEVGQIPQDGGTFLPFLIEYRTIVEDTTNAEPALRLEALKERYPQYATCLNKKSPKRRTSTRKGAANNSN